MMDKRERLFISFSGGETSAMMTWLLLNNPTPYSEIAVAFANTGQENEETLEFVRRCDEAFGFNTAWVEAEVHHNERRSNGARLVNFDTANRVGAPYEETIRKYGVPNMKFPHCTRDLKTNPLHHYIRKHLGWARGTYATAIGIRADEAGRRAKTSAKFNVVYPLLDWLPTTKPEVNAFWSRQDFRLDLMGYQGNCRWCWKKSGRKLMALMDDDPTMFDFPERMERDYGQTGPEFSKPASKLATGYRRTFFRGNLSTLDLRAAHADGAAIFDREADDSLTLPDGRTMSLDLDDGCVESCEIDFAAIAGE